jgi:prepilin-type processing-associated H-X9-DG protein
LADPTYIGYVKSLSHNSSEAWRYPYIHYGYNYVFIGAGVGRTPASPIPAKDLQVKKASETIMLGETNPQTRYGFRADWSGSFYTYHANACNILWVDGHVSSVKNPKTSLNSKPTVYDYYYFDLK